MAQIRPDVEEGHLAQFPRERDLLVPFLNGFDITWAKRRRAYNTELSVYFLLPEKFIQEQFGLDREIMLLVSDYPDLQPRTMQAVESFLNDDPARGRVDQTVFFIVSRDPLSAKWVEEYVALNPQSRIPVVFVWDELLTGRSNAWLVRSTISAQLFSRDLFDYQLPLQNDLFFFGRDAVVAEFLNPIKQSQNRGLFGLRKTGKTSVLFKVKRVAERDNVLVLYYDCKSPALRSLTWESLLRRIGTEILDSATHRPLTLPHDAHVSDWFKAVLASLPSNVLTCLIFDEIEYISPIAKLDPHWHDQFVPFWQTLWTAQSEIRRLSFLIAGVNPTVIEMDTVAGVQNPMFGIVRPKYLTGLEEREVRSMLHHFGRRMGLRFSQSAISYILSRYGGHPLLTRMACSYENTALTTERASRPIDLDRDRFVAHESDREDEISFYCRHIVSELKLFYPDEYDVLELLPAGNIAEYMEFAEELSFTKHLRNYGLLDLLPNQRPTIKIPVLSKFVSDEQARGYDRSQRYLIPPETRDTWLAGRSRRITEELRQLERVAAVNSLPTLYGKMDFLKQNAFATRSR